LIYGEEVAAQLSEAGTVLGTGDQALALGLLLNIHTIGTDKERHTFLLIHVNLREEWLPDRLKFPDLIRSEWLWYCEMNLANCFNDGRSAVAALHAASASA
jgi:hypothetical protein